MNRFGADRAVVALVAGICWLLLGWLAVGLCCCAAGALPGVLGRAARAVSARLLPAALRQAAAVVLGVSVVTSGASATAAVTAPAQHGGPGAAAGVAVRLGPARTGSDIDVDWPAGPSVAPVPARHSVVVAPGDCLWDLAAARLGRGASNARIATEWQRWYAANRAVIGPDPDLIHPGQRLVSPEPHRSDRRDQR